MRVTNSAPSSPGSTGAAMDKTLDVLPGEGEVKRYVVTETKMRQKCGECGEPAHYKHTFLLPNARRNPDSSAYRRDDCSRCEDERCFVCRECYLKSQPYTPKMDEYIWCSTFPASERFAHLFLYSHKKTDPLPDGGGHE